MKTNTNTNTNPNEIHFTINYVPWNIEEMTGYKPISTFWMDFSLAEAFGSLALLDTFENSVKYAASHEKDCYKYLTELSMVLNHKIAQHFDVNAEKGSKKDLLARAYDTLWKTIDKWCCENLTEDELSYYYEITD